MRYEKLRSERDRLVELGKRAKLPRHQEMIKEQLVGIREKIQNAHRERAREARR